MANHHNPYEAAFESYLRDGRLAYVAVNERRRALADEGSLKSADFIVSSEAGQGSWIVDIKGRRFPSGARRPQYWRNWSTLDDLRSLELWRSHFGRGFEAMLVFAYQLTANRSPVSVENLYFHRGAAYAFVGVLLDDYRSHARTLSPKWGTVSMPASRFRSVAFPVGELFGERRMDSVSAGEPMPV